MRRFVGGWLLCLGLLAGCTTTDEAAHGDDGGAGHPQDASLQPETCGVSGASVACTGVGGCRGGQVCKADGSFGECACDRTPENDCGTTGTLVACAGATGCVGLQVCQADGSYTACACSAPNPSLTLDVSAPQADAVVSGTFTAQGTAGGDVVEVSVSIAGGPFVSAAGTVGWSLPIDTTTLKNGKTTLVVSARGPGTLELLKVIPLDVQNIDPLVGAWQNVDRWYGDCRIYFFSSGKLRNSCGVFYGSDSWQREDAGLVTFSGQYVWLVKPVFSQDGNSLTLSDRDRGDAHFVRLANFGESDPDGGVDYPCNGYDCDGGTVDPYYGDYCDGGYWSGEDAGAF